MPSSNSAGHAAPSSIAMERTRRSIVNRLWSGHATPSSVTMERTRLSILIVGWFLRLFDHQDFGSQSCRVDLQTQLLLGGREKVRRNIGFINGRQGVRVWSGRALIGRPHQRKVECA